MAEHIDASQVVELYNKKRSTVEIAKFFNTYPNRIRRILVKAGVKMRDKFDAQKLSVKNGVAKCPTKGTKRDSETRAKIGDSQMKAWETRERKAIKTNIVKQSKKAAKAILKTSREGSAPELFLLKELIAMKENVIFHKKNFLDNEKLEIDLLLPARNLVIEVDGPTHFKPIYGDTPEEKNANLAKKQVADKIKNGLLLNAGYTVLRIKLLRNVSQARLRLMLKNVVDFMNSGQTGLHYIDF